MTIRPVLPIIGMMLSTLALLMIIPAVFDLIENDASWIVFALSSAVTLFVGVALTLSSRADAFRLTIRQAFLMTTLSWVVLSVFAALPFRFQQIELTFTDAIFEAVSGLTTTGATILTGLDEAPSGLLLWRALLQWLGGIGIIVTAIAILPALNIGGMQLFRMESSDPAEKALPRAAQVAGGIAAIYLALTVVWALAYWGAGMNGLEASTHAMTTIATGGFSTSDQSIGVFNSWQIETIAIVGMLSGALPFLLYLRTIQGKWNALWHDTQVQWFLSVVLIVVFVVTAWLWLSGGINPLMALRLAAFNVVSVITGTGYATSDYGTWGAFALPIFFFLMFIGGCAGSTACGIKVFRFQVLYAAAWSQIQHLLQPHGVFIPHYNRRPVSDEVVISVLSFFYVFFFTFTVLAVGISMTGIDFLTALSSAASAISNVGPALGPVSGPSGTYQTMPDAAKWMLSIGMLLGRLELFTVIVLFSRGFWRG